MMTRAFVLHLWTDRDVTISLKVGDGTMLYGIELQNVVSEECEEVRRLKQEH